MDNTTADQKTELLGMNLDYDGGQTLQEAIRWSKFLAIASIAGIGLLAIGILGYGSYYAANSGQEYPYGQWVLWLSLAVFVIYLGAWIAAGILLLRFSLLTKKGIHLQDQGMFNGGLKSLKVTFLILAILSVIGLLLTAYSLIINVM